MSDERTAAEVCEAEAGSLLYKAGLIQALSCAAEAVAHEFEYDEGEMKELSELAADLVKVCEMPMFGAAR